MYFGDVDYFGYKITLVERAAPGNLPCIDLLKCLPLRYGVELRLGLSEASCKAALWLVRFCATRTRVS